MLCFPPVFLYYPTQVRTPPPRVRVQTHTHTHKHTHTHTHTHTPVTNQTALLVLSPVYLHLHLIFKPLLFPPSLLVYQSCISSVSCAPVPVPQSLCAPCVPDMFPVVFFWFVLSFRIAMVFSFACLFLVWHWIGFWLFGILDSH